MANPANTADTTAKTNEVISVEAIEIPQIEAQAQPAVALPNGGVLMGDDLYLISAPSVRQYPDTKKNSTDRHTFAGQEYFLFPVNGKVFTTRDHSFAQAHKTGDLYSVTIGERVVGSAVYLEMLGYVTKTQKLAQIAFDNQVAVSKYTIKRLESFDPKTAPVDADLMGSLLAGASAR
jgi:hypothetical protein